MQCVFTKDPHSVGTRTCTGDFQMSAKPFVVCGIMMGTSQIKGVHIPLPAEVVSGNKRGSAIFGLGSTGVLHSIVNDLQE